MFLAFISYSNPNILIVTLSDLHVELVTDKQEYLLNETVISSIIVYNNNYYPVKLKMITSYSVKGYNEFDTERVVAIVNVNPTNEYIIIPKKSSLSLFTETFTPQSSGRFIISYLGETTTVNVLS